MKKLTAAQMEACTEVLVRDGLLERAGDLLVVTDTGIDAALEVCKHWFDDVLRGPRDGSRPLKLKAGTSYEDALTEFTKGVLAELKSPVTILIHDTAKKAGYQNWIRK